MPNVRPLTQQGSPPDFKVHITTDTTEVGAGVISSSGQNLTLSAATNSIIIAGGQTITTSGATAVDLSGGSGVFKTTTGAATIGSSSTTVTNVIYTDGGIDRSTAATLTVGGTNATTINFGRSGQTVAFQGNVTIAGTEQVTGTTTFLGAESIQNDLTFDGAGAVADDLPFKAGAARAILVNTPAAAGTAGDTLTTRSAHGAAGSGATPGGAGGASTLKSGDGGAGTVTAAAGASSSLTLTTGNAGANGGGGGAGTGAITIDPGAPTGAGVAGALNIGQTNAASIAVGRSGITTTITGRLDQLTGALNLTANAASQVTTSAGALTITSAAAATWSTSAGALTVNGTGGINIQGGGFTTAIVNSTGTQITVQAGGTLNTTSTGNINLPNNGSARFQVEGVAVSANVTAANLGTLTASSTSDASALHTHNNLVGGRLIRSGLTLWATPAAGEVGYLSANNTAAKTDSTAIGTARFFGVYDGTAGQLVTNGVVSMGYILGLTSLTAGAPAYLSTTVGKITKTAPSSGVVAEVGILVDGTGYDNVLGSAHPVAIQVKAPVIL